MSQKTVSRLSEVIRQKAAHVILHEMKDPRLGLVTVTRVKLSSDLSSCIVFYSVLGNDAVKSRTHHALTDAQGFIQRRVGESLRTRTVPHIQLQFDESIEGAIRVGGLLRKISQDRENEERENQEPSETREGE